MQNNRFILASLLAFALTACGGGGGGDDGVQVNQPTQQGKNVQGYSGLITTWQTNGNPEQGTWKLSNQTTSPINSQNYKQFTFESRNFTIYEHDEIYSMSELEKLDKAAYDKINAQFQINGQDGDFTIAPTKGVRGTAYARYGMYWIGDANYKGTNALFYQGVETKDIPKNGEFTYLGKVVAIPVNNFEYGLEFTGNADFKVNFTEKKLTGTLGVGGWSSDFYNPKNIRLTEVKIAADIQGNSFNGTLNNVRTEGKFYGQNADNLAGSFHDQKQKLQGVFGGKKQ